MKKIHVLLFSLLALATTSCKKDKADDSIHLKCKIDGVEKSFNTSALAGVSTDGDESMFIALGLSAASESAEHFSFYIGKTGAITTGTYTVDSEDYSLTGQYVAGSGSATYISSTAISPSGNPQAFKIVISQIDDKTVRGTFSGELYEDGDDSNPKKTVTEGSFYLNITDDLPI